MGLAAAAIVRDKEAPLGAARLLSRRFEIGPALRASVRAGHGSGVRSGVALGGVVDVGG
jgi:hypothetical protein